MEKFSSEFTDDAVDAAAAAGIRAAGWDAPDGASAIARGKQSVWKKTENAASADGFKRIGTDREILSWHSLADPYLVSTEADEARAQARLRKSRKEHRASVMDEKAHAKQVAEEKKRRAEREFRARQNEWAGRQAAEAREQKAFDREFITREAQVQHHVSFLLPLSLACHSPSEVAQLQVQNYYDGADAHARWLYGKSPTRTTSHMGSSASPMASSVSEGAAESPM